MALQALGHEVELVTQDDAGDSWSPEWPVEVHALGRGVTKYGFNRRVDKWVRQNASRFDAVVVNSIWRYLGCGVRSGLQKTGVPYFVAPHSSLNPWFQESLSFKSISKTAIWRLIEWRVLRDACCVLYTCEEERRLARQTYRPYMCKEAVVSLVGTSVVSVRQNSSISAFFDRFPNLRAKRLVLYLSRIHPMKGCDLLIEAFSKICGQDPTLHLVIAGPDDVGFGSSLQNVARESAIESRITWTGPLYEELKWGALLSASLFALPSHCEAFPVALLEALGCGLPALITDKVNIWSEVAYFKAGFVDTDSVEGSVRSLRSWLSLSEAERLAMREAALKCFSDRFESKSSTVRFVESLRSRARSQSVIEELSESSLSEA